MPGNTQDKLFAWSCTAFLAGLSVWASQTHEWMLLPLYVNAVSVAVWCCDAGAVCAALNELIAMKSSCGTRVAAISRCSCGWFALSSQFILLVIYPLVPVVTRLFFFAGYDKLDETKLKKGRARPAHCQSSNATYGFTRLFAVGLWKNTFVSLLHSMAASVLSTWAVYKNTLGAPDLLAVRCQLWHATRRPC